MSWHDSITKLRLTPNQAIKELTAMNNSFGPRKLFKGITLMKGNVVESLESFLNVRESFAGLSGKVISMSSTLNPNNSNESTSTHLSL
jgi:hypothetical protein